MEENKTPKSYEEQQEEIRKQEEERNLRFKETRVNTVNWLTTNKEIQAYFEQFNPHSVKTFIEQYAQKKSLFMEFGESFNTYSEKEALQYFETAQHCLSLIQLKKLYDIRRQWGANQLDLDEIETSGDFFGYAHNVFNCPFVPPINRKEVEMFIAYLQSPDYEINFDELKYTNCSLLFLNVADLEDGSDILDWFDFHNKQTGNNKYLQLFDNRGNLELNYVRFLVDIQNVSIQRKIESGELAPPTVPDKRPLIVYTSEEFIEQFIRKFESKETLNKYKGYESFQIKTKSDDNFDEDEDDYLNEKVTEIIDQMLHLDRPLPIYENRDWRKALIEIWNNYEIESLKNALIPAYEDYRFRVNNNISFDGEIDKFTLELIKNQKEKILESRELKGEPRNFDFLK
jgi:hypothetical protein